MACACGCAWRIRVVALEHREAQGAQATLFPGCMLTSATIMTWCVTLLMTAHAKPVCPAATTCLC